jgi:nicotinate phosphoribosyltransferase
VSTLAALYRPSLALVTDLYQLTMGFAYWKAGVADHEAAFHLQFRHNPFGGGYTVCCGLDTAIEWLERFRFDPEDLDWLSGLAGNDGKPLFEPAFLDWLGALRLTCDVDAVPEGTAVFPPTPLVRVVGPVVQCQLLETALLNVVNFQSLIATKAARVCEAAGGCEVIEFGLRRAQGFDGGLGASRAAYVGGCAGSSNVLAGRLLGIPVRGTHAHSWVMFFEDERQAFREYARAMPNNCIFLVDTYDTLDGVRHAIEAGRRLREQGHEMIGIRLDSGDLAWLSARARQALDEAGFPGAAILASNELDEHIVSSLRSQGARIDAWGVGTRLVTGHDQPALGGVYKLSAVRSPGGAWRHRLKLSDQTIKVSYPGVLQVRRFASGNELLGDAVFDESSGAPSAWTIVDPLDMTRRKTFPPDAEHEDLLVPVLRGGVRCYDGPSLEDIRRRTAVQLGRLHPGVKRFVNPHQHPVGLELGLHERRTALTLEARYRVSRPATE